MKYHPNEIEKRWQQYWRDHQTFQAQNLSEKPKFYVLDMFPYPSGAGLHVGHPLGYIASDIYARFKRHQGFNVLHPMGYDSFGLPAEQYAIQTGQHPALTTEANIKRYREQLDKIGFSFDWSREVRTSAPDYYRWTQWIFLKLYHSWYNLQTDKAEAVEDLIQMFEKQGNATVKAACDADTPTFTAKEWQQFSEPEKQKILLKYRLTYLAESEVNWCPALGTVLANDEVVNGLSERGGHPVVRKKMTQWSMRISAYAERLLQGLEKIDWPEPLKEMQRNWIGKSVGAYITFALQGHAEKIGVFSTRPDTIFGASFMVLAPEHELVSRITTPEQKKAVAAYIETTSRRSERDRLADVKTVSGVFTGAYALHPFTGKPIPVWIADYVLAGYGTGAVMAVPCGDQRDYDFAKHFGLEIPNIFKEVDIADQAHTEKEGTVIANSEFLTGLPYSEAVSKAIEALEKIGAGSARVNYRLRDAVFSRQRYWGEPIPVYFKNGLPYPLPESCLPLRLPEVEKYLPTEEGDPPLGNAKNWAWDTESLQVVANEKIDHQRVFPLELNTMPGWAGSSWYFNRYMDAQNQTAFATEKALNYWCDVDLYIGGSEHATGHLLYSRFWQKFLYDLGLVPVDEYAKKLINQGMILGMSAFVFRPEGENKLVSKNRIGDLRGQLIHVDVSLVDVSDQLNIEKFKTFRPEFVDAEIICEPDGSFLVSREVEKMSKSKYNVVNPDDICEQYGADTLRMYEMFLGPLEQAKPWNTAGITGVFGFLKKLWKLYFDDNGLIVSDAPPSKAALRTLHRTIKKVTEDIENFSFNTSVSSFMIAVNELTAEKCHSRSVLEPLAVLLSPYAPHLAEELWSQLGHQGSVAHVPYPVCDERHLIEDEKEYPVSFNGKMRFTLTLPLSISKEEIEKAVLADERTQKQLEGRSPKKIIVVPGKIVNIVG